MYLDVNDGIYNISRKKICYVLSFMNEGTAATWKEAFLNEVFADGKKDYGTFEQFIIKVKEAFSATDVEGDARAKLRQLRQGKDTTDEYVSQFCILAGRSKITEDRSLVEYFMEGLNTGILQKIFALETVPTTIHKWYELASRFDSQHRRAIEIIGRRRGGNTTSYSQKKTYAPRYTNTTGTSDPNAMDIDRLSTEEREKHFQENQCFNCHKIGHKARECCSKGETNKYNGFKKTASTAKAMIRNLVADMDTEEKEKLIEEITEKQDF
jgi:hypothetical protein